MVMVVGVIEKSSSISSYSDCSDRIVVSVVMVVTVIE